MFNSVDSIGNQHYVFNIRGNNHRLIVVIKFTIKTVLIRFIGTHAEYEDEHYPIQTPSLTDVIKLRMYEMGLNQAKLSKMLGVSPSRVSDYLTRRCEPTLKVAREISKTLHIDANIVLGV